MNLDIRKAVKEDFDRCVEIRGLTRDNPISREILIEYGVTKEIWEPNIDAGTFEGFVAENRGGVVGYCFGNPQTLEILVLALLPDYEGNGLGKKLLNAMVDRLLEFGLNEVWLAASPDPSLRAHGFYRHLGWRPTELCDQSGDEVLKYKK